jgi:hypothetical protein
MRRLKKGTLSRSHLRWSAENETLSSFHCLEENPSYSVFNIYHTERYTSLDEHKLGFLNISLPAFISYQAGLPHLSIQLTISLPQPIGLWS